MARVLAIALVLSVSLKFAFCVPVAKGEKADSGNPDFADRFTNDWKNIYNEERLSRQPRWRLTKDQPEDGSFQIREYESGWWVTSYTPCLNRSVAADFNYLKLYLYLNKYNYQRTSYPYTYPILTKVEIQNGLDQEDHKERLNCPDKASQNVYLPISLEEYPASTPDKSISGGIVATRRYFVREYEEDFSPERCDSEAVNLAMDLARNRRQFDGFAWYCAQYEPGESGQKGIFEVWIEEEGRVEENDEDDEDDEEEDAGLEEWMKKEIMGERQKIEEDPKQE